MQDTLDDQGLRIFEQSIDRRSVREPLQYITGAQEFWGLPFKVTPAVLIRVPETEFVVEAALKAVSGIPAPVIIDLGTGSGCIAVSLASGLQQAQVFAVDRSEKALEIARQNAQRNGVADRVPLPRGRPVRSLRGTGPARSGRCDRNEPAVCENRRPDRLQPEVRDFEPEMALIAGPEGTESAEKIILQAPEYLKERCPLIMEIGVGQTEALKKIIQGPAGTGRSRS